MGLVLPTYSELHQAARNYALAGIPVFPVEVNGKKPVTANGFYDATTDLDQIDAWWTQADYNVATSPGESNLFVVDLDPGYELPRDLPETYTVRTPRGGLHLYYEGVGPSTTSKLGAHIDTRSMGGYVLLPPSRVLDDEKSINGAYRLEKPLPYAPLPEWITEALSKVAVSLSALTDELDLPINVQRTTHYLSDAIPAIEGQGGDESTYRVCCRVRDFGVSETKAFELLSRYWNNNCVPPWTDGELQQKIINAYSYAQNEAGCQAIESPQKVFGALVAKLYPQVHSRFYFKDEEEFQNEPDPQWLVKDLLTERSTVLLYGPTQSYKSFIAIDVSLSLGTGTSTFGSETAIGKVFYSALEGRAHLRKAVRAWHLAHGVESAGQFYLGRSPLIGFLDEIEEYRREIRSRCGQVQQPKLIVLDTLTKSMAGLNENDAKDAGRFIQFCDSLVEEFECSVMVIHHSGKDADKGARGSSAFHAGFDTVIEVKAKRETKAVEVHVRKHKDAEERAEPFTFEGRVVGPSLVFFPTDPKEHRALTHEENEYSPRKIGAALQKLGAYGAEKAVTTAVLAQTITERYTAQSDDQYQNAIARASRALHKASKDFLEAYTVKVAKITKWCLPGQ